MAVQSGSANLVEKLAYRLNDRNVARHFAALRRGPDVVGPQSGERGGPRPQPNQGPSPAPGEQRPSGPRPQPADTKPQVPPSKQGKGWHDVGQYHHRPAGEHGGPIPEGIRLRQFWQFNNRLNDELARVHGPEWRQKILAPEGWHPGAIHDAVSRINAAGYNPIDLPRAQHDLERATSFKRSKALQAVINDIKTVQHFTSIKNRAAGELADRRLIAHRREG